MAILRKLSGVAIADMLLTTLPAKLTDAVSFVFFFLLILFFISAFTSVTNLEISFALK